eukprot:6189373-Pleurochrysis_carterae.AAC.1
MSTATHEHAHARAGHVSACKRARVYTHARTYARMHARTYAVPHGRAIWSRAHESGFGEVDVSHATNGDGPLCSSSSLGMEMDGWRERYQRSLDVAAF